MEDPAGRAAGDTKILARSGPVDQYKRGTVTDRSDSDEQMGLIHSMESGTLVVDVDSEEFDGTPLAEYLADYPPFCTRGADHGLPNRHYLIDARAIAASGRWVRQGGIVGGDVKSNGFTPLPGCVHPSGERYEPFLDMQGQLSIIECTEELYALLVASRASAPKAEGHGGGGVTDGQEPALFSLTGRLVARGVAKEDAWRLWLNAASGFAPKIAGWPWSAADLPVFERHWTFCAAQEQQKTAAIPAGWLAPDPGPDQGGAGVADQDGAQERTGDPESEAYEAAVNARHFALNVERAARLRLDAEVAAAARGPRVKRTAAAHARLPQVPAIISEVLAAEVNLLAGPSAAGKSLLARDWALHVATGEPWRWHRVPEARNVLMILSEGVHDVAQRWATQPLWETAKDRVFILDEPINLLSGTDVVWLLEEYAEERPGLVVFDLVYAAGLADDNTSKDVQPLISALKKISAHWQAATLAVGHNGHNGERRFRGSSAWRQQAATEWHLGDDQLTCEKSKIADARQFAVPCVARYPDLVWPGTNQVIIAESQRRVLIEQDIRARPNESDSARARRLGPVCGLHSAAMRKRIADVAKMIKEMDA